MMDFNKNDDQREFYKSLCVKNLNLKLSNDEIDSILCQEYKQFGEFNIKITQFNGERVAYLNFKYSENARAARYEKPNPYIADRQCNVDPVLGSKYRYGTIQEEQPERYRRAASPRIRNDSDKRDKYPFHLSHLEPEDDPKATRTLFLGNLNADIEESDIRESFERYGMIEDIDIKRPVKGTNNNSYAFVKFVNLDMAHRAKVHMTGKLIKGFQCKVGYGKVTPTKCLWVGGLGPWVQYDLLEKIFSSFGSIIDIDWPLNANYAYILFDNVEAAIGACDKLRGCCLGDSDKRIRLDFTDELHVHNDPGAGWTPDISNTSTNLARTNSGSRIGEISLICGDTYRFNNNNTGAGSHYNNENSRKRTYSTSNMMTLEKATMVIEMIKCLKHVWTGRFSLKTNLFSSRLFYLRGEQRMIDDFLRLRNSSVTNEKSNVQLRIERKLSLDNHLLDEAYLKINAYLSAANSNLVSGSDSDDGICIMLAVANNDVDDVNDDDKNGQDDENCHPSKDSTSNNPTPTKSVSLSKRHLKALSAYFRLKQSAGKVTLHATTADETNTGYGVLHIFPPCSFSHKLLLDSSPLLSPDFARDDFLLLILVRCY